MKFSNFIIILYLLSIPLYSTTKGELTLENLCIQSSDIIIAEVMEIKYIPVNNGFRVYTLVTFNIKESIKGSIQPGEVINIRFLGGKYNGLTTQVSETPLFELEETSLLFLNRKQYKDKEILYIVGRDQGKYEVINDQNTGKEFVYRKNVPKKLRKNNKSLPPVLDQNGLELSQFISEINYSSQEVKNEN